MIEGLKVDALCCVRGEVCLFQSVSLSLKPGEGLWLRGPNGSGKSSLLRILAGLLTPESGTLSLGGHELRRDAQDYRRGLAYIGHLNGLKPNETPRQALAFLAKLRGAYSSFPAALAHTGMQKFSDTQIRYLSAGQRRRIALAGVLASNVALWLLDEPTTALDEASSGLVYDALRAHLARGGMFVAATHDDPPSIPGTNILTLGAA